jgi:hypothetical protein
VNDDWEEFAVYPDAASAEVFGGLLRSEAVPVKIVVDEPVPGLMRGVRLLVQKSLMHRARWVLAQTQPTDEELAALAEATTDESSAADPKR